MFFLFIQWVLSFLCRKTVPVMFWQGCPSQSQSNPFDLYLSTAFYKVPFPCVDTAVFNRKQLLSFYPPSSTSIPKLHYILGGFTLPSVSRAMVWSLLHKSFSVVCFVSQRAGIAHTLFRVVYFFLKPIYKLMEKC